MTTVRRFLVAPSLARLVRKERGSIRVMEGYFPTQSGRNSHVQVEGTQCHLVLVTPAADGRPAEERTEVPRAHADALLDVCGGKAVYDRTRVALGGGREAVIDRFTQPGPLDLISVEFDQEQGTNAFYAPIWFGPEVTAEPAFDRRAMALEGLPQAPDVPLSNAALDSLLDSLEERSGGVTRFARRPAEEANVMDALRRLAMSASDASTTSAVRPAEEDQPAAPIEGDGVDETGFSAHSDAESGTPQAGPDADARIDDVIAGLSRALNGPGGDATDSDVPQVPRAETVRFASRGRRLEG